MIVTMGLPHVFSTQASDLENAKALKVLMTALIDLDVAYLEHHQAPQLYASHVVYGRTNEWETIPAVLVRRFADCKSLAAWRVAELRKQGTRADAVFRWKARANGIRDYHILVVTPKGYEDPSKVLGMGTNENAPMRNGASYR